MDPITSLSVKAVELLVREYGFDGLWKLVRGKPDSDTRIAQLGRIQADLEGALAAVAELQKSAKESQEAAANLQQTIAQLQEDKKAAEELAKVPQEAFERMMQRATAKGRGRGLLEGVAIGLATGFVSSLLVWYITLPPPVAPK